MIICDNCAKEHPRTKEIMVRCFGSILHGTCGWCWNANAEGTVYEVRSDCVAIAWDGKDERGPQRPSNRPLNEHRSKP